MRVRLLFYLARAFTQTVPYKRAQTHMHAHTLATSVQAATEAMRKSVQRRIREL